MKVLLLGANGQLGWELQRTVPQTITLTVCDFPKVDFTSSDSVRACIQSANPDCIINAAAYTAVDKAETEQELAYRINHLAVEKIAKTCQQKNVFLIQISTDFVFNGDTFKPYLPSDQPDPVSIYGLSKLKGEQAVQQILTDNFLIIRTAWLYSSHGDNFVKTMINLMKQGKDLTVVEDQIGTPTWAKGLAKTIWRSLETRLTGIHHWTDAGVASWYDFAVAIQEEAHTLNIVSSLVKIRPVPASCYPTAAKRPAYSVLDKRSLLDKLSITPIHWRSQLRSMLMELT